MELRMQYQVLLCLMLVVGAVVDPEATAEVTVVVVAMVVVERSACGSVSLEYAACRSWTVVRGTSRRLPRLLGAVAPARLS